VPKFRASREIHEALNPHRIRPHAPGLRARARPAEAAKSPANRALSHQASRGRSSPHGAKG
jgi:hypothetical protein